MEQIFLSLIYILKVLYALKKKKIMSLKLVANKTKYFATLRSEKNYFDPKKNIAYKLNGWSLTNVLAVFCIHLMYMID